MINYHNLKNCMHKLGDSHPDLLGIKKFLNAYNNVEISNISNGFDFCAKTQTALAQFQQLKGLNKTGRMNIETWQAIGSEISASQLELMFGRSPSAGLLRNVMYAHKFRRMFPTKTHNALIEYTFGEGKGGGGGLSGSEVEEIALGSRQTDTYFGHGKSIGEWEIDIPITLLVSEAYKHAMVPEDKTVEEAQKLAYEWVKSNTTEARRLQRETDTAKQKYIDAHKDGKPVPTPGPDPNLAPGSINLSALNFFGHACHTYMDSFSPAHHGWQRYDMPKKTITIIQPSGEEIEMEAWDLKKFIDEGLQHKADESNPPTLEERDNCVRYMRGAFLTTFTNKWFKRAVKSESEKQKIYDFVKAEGLSYEEDFGTTEVPQVELPKESMQKI